MSANESSNIAVGSLVGDGKYEILAPLGRGSMGVVWLARHVALDRLVAVKALHPSLTREHAPTLPGVENARVRFLSEARTASMLRHANTVHLLDYGADGDELWFVMEYLEGHTLAEVLGEQGALAPPRAITIVAQVLAALGEAHDFGIVHRDLKPANIMLVPWVDDDGRETELAKVLDFGIATLFTESTASDEVAGTPDYMSPEQAQGLDLDPRSDVYAIGVLLYHLLVGEPPFHGPNAMQTMLAHVNEAPRSPRDRNPAVSEGLASLVLKALAKRPADRFDGVRAFRAALLALPEARHLVPGSAPALPPVVAPAPVEATPAAGSTPIAAPSAPVPSSRTPRVAVVAAVALLVVAAGLALWIGGVFDAPPAIEVAGTPATATAAPPLEPVAPVAIAVPEVTAPAADTTGPFAQVEPDVDAPVATSDAALAMAPDVQAEVVAPDVTVASLDAGPTTALAPTPAEVPPLTPRTAEVPGRRPPTPPKIAEPPTPTPDPPELTPTPPAVTVVEPPTTPEPAINTKPAEVTPVTPPAEVAPKAPSLAATAQVAGLSLRGSLPRSSVQRALDGVRPSLEQCYAQAAKAAGRDAAGQVPVTLSIDVDGHATAIKVGPFALPGVSPCVSQALARIRTRERPDTGTVEASFRVHFQPR